MQAIHRHLSHQVSLWFLRVHVLLATCISPGLVIGGILEDTTYSSRVEAFAPGRRCHGVQTAPLPEPTTGAVAALVNGHPVVCGGARQGRDSTE